VATASQIQAALAAQLTTRLASIEDLQVEDSWVNNPSAPTVDLYQGETYLEKLGFGNGNVVMNYVIRARVLASDHEAQQAFLLTMMEPEGTASVWAAIDYDDTLGNGSGTAVVDQASIINSSGLGYFPPEDSMLGCTWTVRVIP
jgi:hypothetical protein